MSLSLAEYSDAIARLVATAAPMVCAIRVGPNRHISGLVCQSDLVVTVDQALPALDSYTVVVSGRSVVQARPHVRDAATNLVFLRLDAAQGVHPPQIAGTFIGSLVIIVGADADASPTARLTVVHRMIRAGADVAPVLDLPAAALPGSLVLDANGRLVGLASEGPAGEAITIPSDAISRLLMPANGSPMVSGAVAPPTGRRGWLGVSLQPISVPDAFVAKAGQTSGRMVVHVTRSGPADKAGIIVGDVLLSLNGTSASGPLAMRAFLSPDRIGSTVEVRLLREGQILTAPLTVGSQRE